jgi:uncharacterized protein YaiL (DUF2058 family)
MSMSLREQLLAAGLGNKKQAKQAEQQEHQQRQLATKNKAKAREDEQRRVQQQAQAQATKAARDQELNRQRDLAAAKKAQMAEIKQLIAEHRIPRVESDEYFNFVHKHKVRRISVDAAQRERIIRGEVMIVRCEGRYDLVPAAIAERIRERNERTVVVPSADQNSVAENDPYKDFAVPDDLTW